MRGAGSIAVPPPLQAVGEKWEDDREHKKGGWRGGEKCFQASQTRSEGERKGKRTNLHFLVELLDLSLDFSHLDFRIQIKLLLVLSLRLDLLRRVDGRVLHLQRRVGRKEWKIRSLDDLDFSIVIVSVDNDSSRS